MNGALTSSARLSSTALKVVTYNVLNSTANKSVRVPALLGILEKADADFILMQECGGWFEEWILKEPWVKEQYKCSGRVSPTVFPFKPSDIRNVHARKAFEHILNVPMKPPADAAENPPGCLMILSKHHIQNVAYYQLPSTDMYLRTGEGGLLVVETEVAGRPFVVANTHLDSGNGIPDQRVAGLLRSVQLDLISTIFQQQYPDHEALFGGDFNFGDCDRLEHSHIPVGFDDAWLHLNFRKSQDGFTWDMDKSSFTRECSTHKDKNKRVDRLCVRQTGFLESDKIDLLGDHPVGCTPSYDFDQSSVWISDHFGVQATLVMRPEGHEC